VGIASGFVDIDTDTAKKHNRDEIHFKSGTCGAPALQSF